MSWRPASKDEAQAARSAGLPVKFTPTGWEIEEGGGPETAIDDLTKQAADIFEDMIGPPAKPLQRTSEGRYVTNWIECECGEQYVVRSEHERSSARHKQWSKGGMGQEVPVPPQPLYSAYPRGAPTPRLEMGVNKICERCGAKNKKGEDYYPDKDSRPENRFPCRRCNGHGVRPNIGPA
jgi:hypothetical protein